MLDTRSGKVKPQVSNSIANIVDKLLKCYQITEVEEKLKEVVQQFERQQQFSYKDLSADIIDCLDLDDEDPKRLK